MPDNLLPGQRLEEEVANIFRMFGAKRVELHKELAGNQIDVYVEEETGAGTILKTIAECKDYSRKIGVGIVNDFARKYQLLRDARLADLALIVARGSFRLQACEAAETYGVELLQLSDLTMRVKKINAMQVLTVMMQESLLNLNRSGDVLVLPPPIKPRRLLDDSLKERVPIDPRLPERIKRIARYILEVEKMVTNLEGKIVMLDITGSATGFKNWLTNPLYESILVANQEYNVAYKKDHGKNSIGVIRNFIIDSQRLSDRMINNIQQRLDLHVSLGLEAGIIYIGSRVPKDVVADIANLSDQIVIDFGNIEQFDTVDMGLRDVIARKMIDVSLGLENGLCGLLKKKISIWLSLNRSMLMM